MIVSIVVFLQALAKQVLSLLKAIAGNDDVKVAIVKAGGVEHILAVMTKHQKISSVCNNGCAALGAVALRNPDHCTKMVEMGSAVTITTAMKLHPQFQNVQVYYYQKNIIHLLSAMNSTCLFHSW